MEVWVVYKMSEGCNDLVEICATKELAKMVEQKCPNKYWYDSWTVKEK
jgi:hypothetical protein